MILTSVWINSVTPQCYGPMFRHLIRVTVDESRVGPGGPRSGRRGHWSGESATSFRSRSRRCHRGRRGDSGPPARGHPHGVLPPRRVGEGAGNRPDGNPTGHVLPVLDHGDAEPQRRRCQQYPARARQLRSGIRSLIGLLDAGPCASGGGPRPACRHRPWRSSTGAGRPCCPGRPRRSGRHRTVR